MTKSESLEKYALDHASWYLDICLSLKEIPMLLE
jgi:hypothetical protein